MRNVRNGHDKPIVCLDAGHYGKYNRSPVVKAYYESDMNWKLHNYLTDELLKRGIEVWKTRTNQGTDKELTARGKASKGADLFISIHSNACDTESVDRPVGIYLVDDNCGGIDEASKEIAGLLANTVAEVMQTRGKAQVYSKLASGDRDGDGKKNDDYYGVLFGCHQVGTAGIILEHSFHTNTRATKWLLDDNNLKRMAEAEADVIAKWFGLDVPQAAPEKPVDTIKNDYAKEFHQSEAGKYRVKSNTGLNLRTGADTRKHIIENMPDGSVVTCYGYHTGNWLYVVSASGAEGFCYSAYLTKL